MVTVINNVLVGVICKDRLEFSKWVNKQSYNPDRKYVPITSVSDIKHSYDEIVETTTATANPSFVDIYIKLNGAYRKVKKENIAV